MIEHLAPFFRQKSSPKLNSALLILEDDRRGFLMQIRSASAKVMPSSIGFFGGGIEDGETPLQAAHREMGEELEITGDLQYIGDRYAKVEESLDEKAFFFFLNITDIGDNFRVNEGAGHVFIRPRHETMPELAPRDRAVLRNFQTNGTVSSREERDVL